MSGSGDPHTPGRITGDSAGSLATDWQQASIPGYSPKILVLPLRNSNGTHLASVMRSLRGQLYGVTTQGDRKETLSTLLFVEFQVSGFLSGSCGDSSKKIFILERSWFCRGKDDGATRKEFDDADAWTFRSSGRGGTKIFGNDGGAWTPNNSLGLDKNPYKYSHIILPDSQGGDSLNLLAGCHGPTKDRRNASSPREEIVQGEIPSIPYLASRGRCIVPDIPGERLQGNKAYQAKVGTGQDRCFPGVSERMPILRGALTAVWSASQLFQLDWWLTHAGALVKPQGEAGLPPVHSG